MQSRLKTNTIKIILRQPHYHKTNKKVTLHIVENLVGLMQLMKIRIREDYRSHFDACAMLDNWNEREKGLYLAVSLRGQAQGVLGNLPYAQKHDYALLVIALKKDSHPPIKTISIEPN